MKIKRGEKIFGELGAVDEVILVCEGSYKVGFTINNKEKFVIGLPHEAGNN
jgi:hypothetical protein